MIYDLVEGWTSAIEFDLLAKGSTPTTAMTGFSAELVLIDENGNQVDTSGDVSIIDENNWVVRYIPDSADLVVGIYRGRFKITDTSSGVAYFPSAEHDIWIVRSVA